MDTYSLIAVVIAATAVIGYLNHLIDRLPTSVGIMFGATVLALSFMLLQNMGFPSLSSFTERIVAHIQFHNLLMNGLLGLLLFAGSMTIDFELLRSNLTTIATLASFSVITSTLLLGTAVYYLLPLFHVAMPFLYCLLFGALISPTDPIAVLASFKKIGAPKKLHVIVAGESLFNDGISIVIFITLYHLTLLNEPVTLQHISYLFFNQAIGGLLFGLLLGVTSNFLIRNTTVQIAALITIAIATSGYTLANTLGLSGPLAMVIAGIFIGNKNRKNSRDNKTNQTLTLIWELIDDILNAILFLLLGFELIIIHSNYSNILAGLTCIPLALAIRYITVAIPTYFLFTKKTRPKKLNATLTWGGLRGGLAVALALALPNSPFRNSILTMTFCIVAFAVIVQGMTIQRIFSTSTPDKKHTTS